MALGRMVSAESRLLYDSRALADPMDHGCNDQGQLRVLLESSPEVLMAEAQNKDLVCHDDSSEYRLSGLYAHDLGLAAAGEAIRLSRGLVHDLVACLRLVRGLHSLLGAGQAPHGLFRVLLLGRTFYNNYGWDPL